MPAAALIPVIAGAGAGAAGIGGLTLGTGLLAGAAVGSLAMTAQGMSDAKKAASGASANAAAANAASAYTGTQPDISGYAATPNVARHISTNRANGYYGPEWTDEMIAQDYYNNIGKQAGEIIPMQVPTGVGNGSGGVNLGAAQQAAQSIAFQNAANSRTLEDMYNPGAGAVRTAGLDALLGQINAPSQGIQGQLPGAYTPGSAPVSAANQELLARVSAQAGKPLEGASYDSALTRAAIAKAQSDLALGGMLPQDVRNLIARQGLAKSGTVSQGLGLGRDIVARDLGLTSLQLENARLQQALQAGQAEVGLNQGNAAMGLQAQQYARNNLLQSQGATAADQAQQLQAYFQQQQLAQQAAAQEASNYFNQNNLIQSIQSGDFSRAMAGAQFGQSIAQPQSGLDPGSIVNLAVGNSNMAANAQQNANALAAGAANQQAALGGQILGAVGGFAGNYFRPQAPAVNYSAPSPNATYPSTTAFLKP
jgi:hypothetical protein